MIKLMSVFPSDFDYLCEKLPEYAERKDRLGFQKGAVIAEQVQDILLAFQEILAGRCPGIGSRLERVLHALHKLRGFFENQEDSTLTVEDAYVFGSYAKVEAMKIRDMALEADTQARN